MRKTIQIFEIIRFNLFTLILYELTDLFFDDI